MPVMGIVADDLTGASTVGTLLARRKARASVFFDIDTVLESQETAKLDVILISTDSRSLLPKEAYKKVKKAVEGLKTTGVRYFQKRIDTTCRGGVGVEIDAVLDSLPGTVAIVVPAMPQSRRILVGGYSVIDGEALVNTHVAKDVLTPVKEAYIPRLIGNQTKRKVGFVALDKVLSGVAAIEEALKKQKECGCEIIVVDAITQEDVRSIAEASVSLKWDVVSVDPGPFTIEMAKMRNLIGKEEPRNLPEYIEAGRTVLIAAGSATEVTKKQMEQFCRDKRHVRISVDPLLLGGGGTGYWNEAARAAEAAEILLQGENERARAILFETALHDDRLDLENLDKKLCYEKGTSGKKINAGLAEIIAQVLERTKKDRIAGIYMTGGDTMASVCRRLGAESIMAEDYVIPQADVGRLSGGKYNGLPIIGKGGLTGNDEIVYDIVERLFRESERKD